ncbi:hypothetical protein ACIA9I_12305 [Streptomyces anulatus]
MTRQLTTQNATITTAAVEVKTLTISGKQVTLAVFRQLQEEPLIAWDGTLKGEPWGTVNYHPDKCSDSPFAHSHVVWQRGVELHRARVDKIPSFETGGRYLLRVGGYERRDSTASFKAAETDRFLTGSVLEWLAGRADKCPLEARAGWTAQYDDRAILDSGHGFSAFAKASKAAVEAANARTKADEALAAVAKKEEEERANPQQSARWEWQSLDQLQAEAGAANAEASAALNVLVAEVAAWGLDLSDVRAAHDQLIEAEAARRERHRAARRSLAELPQLFIAV